MHVGACLDQRDGRFSVAFVRRQVQRRPPAQPKKALLQLNPEWMDRLPAHRGESTTRGCRPEKPYPRLSLQCTSAPAFTSASAVAVWPFNDAKCSAVLLQSHNRHYCSSTPSGRTVRRDTVAQHRPEAAAREPYFRPKSSSLKCMSAPLARSAATVAVSPASAAVSSSLLCTNNDSEPLSRPPRRAQARWTQTHPLAAPIGLSGALGTIALGSTGRSAVLGVSGSAGAHEDLQPVAGRSRV